MNDNLLPKFNRDFGNLTINELMADSSTEFVKKNNYLSFRRVTDKFVATIEYQNLEDMETVQLSTVGRRDRKSEYLTLIADLQRKGYSQKEIAYKLGLSPSYVSQLLRKR